MNDGSSLVLFEVFLKLVRDLSKGGTGLDGSLLHTFETMGMHIVWLSLGEACPTAGALISTVPCCGPCSAEQRCCAHPLAPQACTSSGCFWVRHADIHGVKWCCAVCRAALL